MNVVKCPFGDTGRHNYVTVVTKYYTIPGCTSPTLDRTRAYVVCTKCGDVIKIGDDE